MHEYTSHLMCNKGFVRVLLMCDSVSPISLFDLGSRKVSLKLHYLFQK